MSDESDESLLRRETMAQIEQELGFPGSFLRVYRPQLIWEALVQSRIEVRRLQDELSLYRMDVNARRERRLRGE